MEKFLPASGLLPPLRENIRFVSRSRDIGGDAVWLVFDPLRNRYLELRPVAYELLSRWGLGSIEALIDAMARETRHHISRGELGEFIAYLAQNQLLRRSTSPKLPPEKGLLAQLEKSLSSLVFFRVRLIRPDRMLSLFVGAVSFIFSAPFWVVMAFLGVSSLVLVSRQWDEFLATFTGFLDVQGATVLLLAIVFAKTIHELGHAFAAKHLGCHVPAMGLMFILGLPLAYTDVSDSWRVENHRHRLLISCGGIIAETILAILCTWGWLLLPDGPARTACFTLATTGWIATLAINLNPFMRFDGYYILADLIGMRNLQTRCFAMGKWQLRRAILGWRAPVPEIVPPRLQHFMIAFAWSTWVIRSFIFAGIAMFAYVMLGKPFGVIIAIFEIWLLLLSPLVRELATWIAGRKNWLAQPRAWVSMALLGLVLAFVLVPQSFRVGMPAILTPQDRLVIHASDAALIADFPTENRQVKAGDVLLQLQDPDLDMAIAQSDRKLQIIALAKQQTAVNQMAARENAIIDQEYAEEQARMTGLIARRERLTVCAPFAGLVTDIDPLLAKGIWVNREQPLFLLVAEGTGLLTAYVDERDRSLVSAGSAARFYPEAGDYPVMDGVVRDVQSVPAEFLTEPMLASINGGEIPVREDVNGQLVPEHGQYQVMVEMPDQHGFGDIHHVLRGVVYSQSKPYSLAGYAYDRVRALLSRETGF
ncbi:HlyD family efflux transporter periplasmic adaptor subunit [Thalassospira marina]|uniref:Peptidase M50 domain-containing protein n=1 Tax=Thalassospira marina TaxID=2048283 RepID=A0A2N3KYL4_9PROT|nr:HlyD family efflux transporter periplasmic adaptor subunit [Thalassospira marina]PKR55655.1 hypothetical protein COO20_00025 [Thalassospira marina]